MAAFAAPYGALLRCATNAATDATLTIEPPPRARSSGSACLLTRNVPPACTVIIRFQRSNDHSSIGPNSACPPALKTQSTPPSCCWAVREGLLHRGLVGDVAPQADRALEVRGDRLGPHLVQVRDRDPPALLGEAAGDGSGDARPPSRGEQDLVGEAHRGLRSRGDRQAPGRGR